MAKGGFRAERKRGRVVSKPQGAHVFRLWPRQKRGVESTIAGVFALGCNKLLSVVPD